MKTAVWVIALLLLRSSTVVGQCDSLGQRSLIDSTVQFYPLVSGGQLDTANPYDKRFMVPYHQFSFMNDTTGTIVTYSEYRYNNRWILLDKWCMNKLWNWSIQSNSDTNEVTNSQLSNLSKTQVFTIGAGDTISVLRKCSIQDYIGDSLAFKRSDQTIPVYAVTELVNVATSTIVDVLDSVRFHSVSGQLCYTGFRPMLARIVHVVPTGTDSTEVYIRIRVGAEGSESHWYRRDYLSTAVSKAILPRAHIYNNRYEQWNQCGAAASNSNLSISTNYAPTTLHFECPAGYTYRVYVYSVDGMKRAEFDLGPSSTVFDMSAVNTRYVVGIVNLATMQVETRHILVQP